MLKNSGEIPWVKRLGGGRVGETGQHLATKQEGAEIPRPPTRRSRQQQRQLSPPDCRRKGRKVRLLVLKLAYIYLILAFSFL